jgi:hypothetical protein
MTTYDFINANIGKTVLIDGSGDLGCDGELKPLIYDKVELILLRLNKKGLAIVKDPITNKEYSVPPKNIILK